MPTLNRPRISVLPLAVVISLGLMALSFSWQVPTVKAAGAANAESSEIVRLINGARAAAGKSALRVDTYLAGKARDGAIPCPDNAAKSIAGRAKDFAAYGKMSHNLRLCDAATYTLSSTLFVTQMQKWGYGSVGEIDLVNAGYGTGKYLYTSGSYSTYTYATSGHALVAWKTSSSHWNIIMGGYDRVGCGAWSPSGSTFYYDCVFSAGGPNGTTAPPTRSPFPDPVSTPTGGAATPAPVVTPAPAKTPVRTGGGGKGSGSATTGPTDPASPVATDTAGVTPIPTPTIEVAGAQSDPTDAAPEIPAAAQGAGAIGGNPTTTVPEGLTREAVLGFAAGSAALLGFWVLLDRFRRRRRVSR